MPLAGSLVCCASGGGRPRRSACAQQRLRAASRIAAHDSSSRRGRVPAAARRPELLRRTGGAILIAPSTRGAPRTPRLCRPRGGVHSGALMCNDEVGAARRLQDRSARLLLSPKACAGRRAAAGAQAAPIPIAPSTRSAPRTPRLCRLRGGVHSGVLYSCATAGSGWRVSQVNTMTGGQIDSGVTAGCYLTT